MARGSSPLLPEARRVWLSGGRVLAVCRDGVPGRNSVAAILRYPL